MKKFILYTLVLILVAGGGTYYYVFIYSKNRTFDMAGAEAVAIEANALVKAFQENEAQANKTYLDKVLLVKGTVSNTAENQTGEHTVTLSSDDPFAGVMATLDSTETKQVKIGDNIQVKGFCKGFLSDVVINNGIIVK